MIMTFNFNHSNLVYQYKFHISKMEGIKNIYPSLNNYLVTLNKMCPNDYFSSGPRSSALRFKLNLDIKSIQGHELSQLTKHALKLDGIKSAHLKVQTFLIEKDNKSVATEVPIWITKDELVNYKELFKSELPLTGHIDLLRIEDNTVWVWDYKPYAKNEKYAATQVYFYSLMLSKRTGIPLSNFMGGYFDKDNAYIFKPREDIASNTNLSNFLTDV